MDNMILLAKHKRAKGQDGFSVSCVLFIVKYNHKEKAVFDCVRDNYLGPEDRSTLFLYENNIVLFDFKAPSFIKHFLVFVLSCILQANTDLIFNL